MAVPRVSILKMMAVIAIAGLDCALARLFVITRYGWGGLFAVSVATSVGLTGVLLARGCLRRFSAGFALAIVATTACLVVFPVVPITLFNPYFNVVFEDLPRWMTAHGITFWFSSPSGVLSSLYKEVAFGLPQLAVAFLGGLLAALTGRRVVVQPGPGPVDSDRA